MSTLLRKAGELRRAEEKLRGRPESTPIGGADQAGHLRGARPRGSGTDQTVPVLAGRMGSAR
jgi:hypothetical protein